MEVRSRRKNLVAWRVVDVRACLGGSWDLDGGRVATRMGEGEMSSALRMVAALMVDEVPRVGSSVVVLELVEVGRVNESAMSVVVSGLVVVRAVSAKVMRASGGLVWSLVFAPVAAVRAEEETFMVIELVDVGLCEGWWGWLVCRNIAGRENTISGSTGPNWKILVCVDSQS